VNNSKIMVQDTWPLCSTQNAFSFRDLENATVSELWSKKKSQLFCDDEEDMLVEKGMISSEGKYRPEMCSDFRLKTSRYIHGFF